MAKDKYIIIAGAEERPETVTVGTLEKGTGQSVVKDETQYPNKRGDIGIPNRTEAWGQRIIIGNTPKPNEGPVDVRDPRYKGDITWLPWGDPKGTMIIARYLRGYNTLDQQYQDLVLGAKSTILEDNEASADAFYLRLQSGDNYYDPETDRMLVQMYKIHYLNKDSKSKDPDQQTNHMYWEKKVKEEDKKIVDDIKQKFEAQKFVFEASEDNSGEKLKNLYGILSGLVDEKVSEDKLLTYLTKLADSKPELVIQQIESYKRNWSNILLKAESYDIFDLTTDGTIVAGDKKKEIIAEGIPGKGKDMLQWLMENILDSKALECIARITKIVDTLK